jgi:hypothetical protein
MEVPTAYTLKVRHMMVVKWGRSGGARVPRYPKLENKGSFKRNERGGA